MYLTNFIFKFVVKLATNLQITTITKLNIIKKIIKIFTVVVIYACVLKIKMI
jgi:hypothetical protein